MHGKKNTLYEAKMKTCINFLYTDMKNSTQYLTLLHKLDAFNLQLKVAVDSEALLDFVG